MNVSLMYAKNIATVACKISVKKVSLVSYTAKIKHMKPFHVDY